MAITLRKDSPRLAFIATVVGGIACVFLYCGGWLTPDELTPARIADGFEQVSGVHPGFRRNHAKGVDVYGFFESNGNGASLSSAVVFRPGRVPVIGRFSLGSPAPYVADGPDMARGLGLQFALPDGEYWRTGMVNLPVFPVSTPEAFYGLLLASKPDSTTGKPDPAKMGAFLASYPESGAALKLIKSQPPSSGFDNSTFHSLNAFWFVSAAGNSVPVRWILTPMQPFEAAKMDSTSPDKNYLFDGLIARIHDQPLQWRLIIIVGQAGDPTDDATIPWPPERQQVDVGTVTLDRVESDDTGAARDINFDPLMLPAGIEPSDDPLLSARSAVYSQSFTRREGEAKEPSAVSSAEVGK
jgi:catalase